MTHINLSFNGLTTFLYSEPVWGLHYKLDIYSTIEAIYECEES